KTRRSASRPHFAAVIRRSDRIWLKRLTGEGEHPDRLDAIIYEDRCLLAAARADEDERIVRYVNSLDEASMGELLRYSTTSGKPFEQKRVIFWRTCSITRHIIAVRPTRSFLFVPAENHPRWIS